MGYNFGLDIRQGRWTSSLVFRAAVLALTMCLVTCGVGHASQSGDGRHTRDFSFAAGPCPESQAASLAALKAQCGILTVPEHRPNPRGRTIQLPVVRIPSVAQPPSPDPVVYLAGGPGTNAIPQAPILVQVGLNQNRDLIIMNQRGVALTRPALTCPNIDRFNIEAVGLRYDSPDTGRLHVAATKECHDALVNQGIDLSAYNTTENSADFADLRKALRIAHWNVYGLSYGTYLALSLMRDHPEGIRSVIIDSVQPPSVATLGWTWTNANEGINNIFRACDAQPRCKRKYGDLASAFAKQVSQLEAKPLKIRGRYSPDAKPVKVVLDGGALVNWLASVPDPIMQIPSYPSAIAELVQGRPTQIANSRAALADPAGIGTVGYGLLYGVICREWVPFEPESQILAQGLLAFPTYPTSVLSLAPHLPFMTEDCGVWNVPRAPDSERRVTISSIPTLVMAGSFDGKTSPQWALYAARTLQNSTTVVIPGAGHGALFLIGLPPDTPAQSCARSVVASFLSAPMDPDVSCVANLRPLPFTISATMFPPDQIDQELQELPLLEAPMN